MALLDEVPPVAGTERDGRAGEVRPGLQVEQPADVVGVQMGADDVGNVVPLDPQGPEPGGKLAAEQAADGVLVAGGHRGGPPPRVDQNAPVTGAEKEAADREPGLAAAVEQVAVSGGGGVVAEVAGAGDERPVGDGAQLDAANVHRPRPRAVRRVRRPIQATDGSGRRLARRANQARRSGRACGQLGYGSPRNLNRPPSARPAPGSARPAPGRPRCPGECLEPDRALGESRRRVSAWGPTRSRKTQVPGA